MNRLVFLDAWSLLVQHVPCGLSNAMFTGSTGEMRSRHQLRRRIVRGILLIVPWESGSRQGYGAAYGIEAHLLRSCPAVVHWDTSLGGEGNT